MKKRRIAILIGVLVILCICVVLVGVGIYFLLGGQPDLASPQATNTIVPIETTPVQIDTVMPEPTPVMPYPTIAVDTPLATETSRNAVSGAQLPASHRIAVDKERILHLVWGDTAKGFFHQQMTPDGMWGQAELLTGDLKTLFGLVDLIPNPEGQACVFVDGATNSNVPSTSGMYMRCQAAGQWTPIGNLYARGDWQHPPAFAADGTVRVVELDGPGRAPVRFGEMDISSDEGYVHQLQFAIDGAGELHAVWVRSSGDSYAVEVRHSGDGGQTWSEVESLADIPSQLTLLSLKADTLGNVHAGLWAGTDGVFYKRWMPAAGWEPAVKVTGELTGGSWGDLTIGPDGLAHIVWGNEFADVKHYVRQQADGSWSQPRPITDETVTDARIAIDAYGVRHVVWRGPDDGLYHIMIPPATPAELGGIEGKVAVSTDQTSYKAGSVVRIALTNNLDVPIWYAQQVDCGLSFWLLERCESGESIQHRVLCVWAAPQHKFTVLGPGETVTDEWPGTLEALGDSGVIEQPAEPGCYRLQIPFSLSPVTATWGQDKIEAYSNDFMIR